MIQVENEYGSYGSDKEYRTDINRKMFIDAGFDGLLYTCDPTGDVGKGHGWFTACSKWNRQTCTNKENSFMKITMAKGPFYVTSGILPVVRLVGHQTSYCVPAEKYTPGLDGVLAAGISINMYMFRWRYYKRFYEWRQLQRPNPYRPQIKQLWLWCTAGWSR